MSKLQTPNLELLQALRDELYAAQRDGDNQQMAEVRDRIEDVKAGRRPVHVAETAGGRL